jgi:hypothetical protein
MKKLIAITLIVMVILANIAEDAYAKSKLDASKATTLGAGDIAIIGYNTLPAVDVVAILFLKDITEGTEIKFTDRGWNATSSPQGFIPSNSEEVMVYWLADRDYMKGEYKPIALTSDGTSISINPKSAGDQIFIFQGDPINPTLIYGVNISWTDWNNSEYPGYYNSGQPPQLIEYSLSYNYFNAKYIDKTNFDNVEAAQAAIANTKNWQGDDSAQQTLTFPDFSFGPTAIELNKFASENKPPSSLAGAILTILMAIGIAALLLRTSSKRHNS